MAIIGENRETRQAGASVAAIATPATVTVETQAAR